MRTPLLGIALVALTSCASMDRAAMMEFVPRDAGTFAVRASADVAYPEDSPTAEEIRLDWIDQFVRDNDVCPGDWTILSRRPVLVREAALGRLVRIFYEGRCI